MWGDLYLSSGLQNKVQDAGRGQTIQCEDPIGMRDVGRLYPMLMIRS